MDPLRGVPRNTASCAGRPKQALAHRPGLPLRGIHGRVRCPGHVRRQCLEMDAAVPKKGEVRSHNVHAEVYRRDKRHGAAALLQHGQRWGVSSAAVTSNYCDSAERRRLHTAPGKPQLNLVVESAICLATKNGHDASRQIRRLFFRASISPESPTSAPTATTCDCTPLFGLPANF